MNRSTSTSGFTIIELLVVIAIIVALIAILLPSLSGATYVASNAKCLSNLRQQAIGVTSYAASNTRIYPTHSGVTTTHAFAPTLMRQTNLGLDYRDLLLSYFGSMKGVFACPQASETYSEGAAAYGAASRDLDTTTSSTVVISYSQWYGRTPTTSTPATDPAWGTGSANFRIRKGMLRYGDHMEFDAYRPEDSGARYRMLASDVMWLWGTSLVWTHESRGAAPLGTSTYGESFGNAADVAPDFNFVTDDGAARGIQRVGFHDPRITLARPPGAWGWAWILPSRNQ